MNRRVKYLLIVIGIGIASAFLYIYFAVYNKAHRSIINEKPAYTIAAIDLYNDYSKDEKIGDKKYLNQLIEIYGKISAVSHNLDGEVTIEFKEEDNIGGVVISLDSTYYHQEPLSIGEPIHVKGICVGMLLDVTLNKGIIKKNQFQDKK